MTDEEIHKLLEENIALTKEVRSITHKTENYLKWLRITDIVKILLIVLPLIAAWIYLPGLISGLTAGYSEVLPPELFTK